MGEINTVGMTLLLLGLGSSCRLFLCTNSVLLTEGKLQGPMQVWKIALGKFSHVRPSKTVMQKP